MQAIKCYFNMRGKGFSHAISYSHSKMFVSFFDVIVLFIGLLLACIAYQYCEIKSHDAVVSRLKQDVVFNQSKALKNELLLVSVLNGSLLIDGKPRSFCMLNAVGDCKL